MPTCTTVDVEDGGGGGEPGEITIDAASAGNPRDNTVDASFTFRNTSDPSSGDDIDVNYSVSLDGTVEESGMEPGLSPGEMVDLQYQFTDVSSGPVTVTFAANDRQEARRINVSGDGGGGQDPDPLPGPDPDPEPEPDPVIGGIDRNLVIAGAIGLGAIAIAGGGSSNDNPGNNGR